MRISRGRAEGAVSVLRDTTFTGTVWADPVLPSTDGVVINSVAFTPGARTHWHHHEIGQVLLVTSGQGLVVLDTGEREVIRAGDVVWFAPGEVHWHGADTDAHMVHTAISIGKTVWGEPVTDDEYRGTAAGR